MTLRAYQILKNQRIWKDELLKKLNGRKAPEGFEDLVFVTTRNAPINQTDTDLVMKFISDRIAEKHDGFKPLTPHTLRHTFATRCIERGMNPKTVQVIMGHSSVNITMNLYCHVTENTLFSEMQKFESGVGTADNISDGVKLVSNWCQNQKSYRKSPIFQGFFPQINISITIIICSEMDCIVTRNIKDYVKAPIEVYQNKNVDIFSENIGIF